MMPPSLLLHSRKCEQAGELFHRRAHAAGLDHRAFGREVTKQNRQRHAGGRFPPTNHLGHL
jgi:hypothetical protein